MKKSIIFLSLITAQSAYAQEKTNDGLKETTSSVKSAVFDSIKIIKKHPLPTLEVVGGSAFLLYGTIRLTSLYNIIGDVVIGVPATIIGILLIGKGLSDVDKAK